MHSGVPWIVLVLTVFSWQPSLPATDIPRRCDRGDCVGGALVPLGCGIPLKEGRAKGTEGLAMETPGKGLVPAQFEVRTRYESGSIMWLWADFVALPGEQYTLVFDKQNPAVALPDISIRQTDREIVVHNGTLEFPRSRHSWAGRSAPCAFP
jgi:hypothetical protein